MEDRYMILIESKDNFITIFDAVQKLSKFDYEKISDNAIMFMEFVKEFYMNYPLVGQPSSILCSTFNEVDFLKAQDKEIIKESVISIKSDKKNLKMTQHEERLSSFDSKMSDGTESNKSNSFLDCADELSKKDSSKEDYNVLKDKVVYFGYGKNAIISLIQSPYLSTKLIIRDITGRHAWIINQHRVIDADNLEGIQLNDSMAVRNNALKLQTKLTEDDNKFIEENLNFKKILKDVPKDSTNIEEEIKKTEDKCVLVQVLKLLSKYYPTAKEVLFNNKY